MPWWAWLVLGAVLLAAEAGLQTDFWLAVVGLAALGTGALGWIGVPMPVWAQWAVFGAGSVFLAVFVRRRVHERLVGTAPGVKDALIGELARVEETIEPGARGAVVLRGSSWQAMNVGGASLVEGAEARVVSVEGVVLQVRA